MLLLSIEAANILKLILTGTYYERDILILLYMQCLHILYIVMTNDTFYTGKGLHEHCLAPMCVGLLNISFEKSGGQQPIAGD